MGALTTLTKWIPEDDLLLKNAVEGGASLESLAKGAVQFSRRFTIRELQDRWRSLLYDLDTSTEASARIVEIEIELAASNLPKPNRACNSNFKGNEASSGKRRSDSVRSHYYAMRKRIRSEPCASSASLLMPPAYLADNGYDNGLMDQTKFQNKQSVDNFALQMPCSNDFGHPETGYDSGHHTFDKLMRVDSTVTNVPHQLYHPEHVGSVEDEIRDGASREAYLYGITGAENITSAQCDEAEFNNGNKSSEHNFQQRDFPNILGENLISENSPDVHEICQSNALDSPYKNDSIGTKALSGFDSSNNNHEVRCYDSVRNDNLSSRVPDSSHSFHQFGYSSPSSGLPIWRTMEDIATPTMPMDGHCTEKDPRVLNMDGHENIDAPQRDVSMPEPKLDTGMSGSGLNNPAIMPENEFMDFSETYMDFDNDESFLFIDVDEKDDTDRPCLGLSSILLSSPSGSQHGIADSNDLGTTNVSETCLGIPDAAYPEKPVVLRDKMHSSLHNDENTSAADVNIPSTSTQTPKTAEPRQEFMICALNMQDLEVPDNDHIIFPDHGCSPFSSNPEQLDRETGRSLSVSVSAIDGRGPVGDLNKLKEHTTNAQSLSMSKLGVIHTCDGCAVETESFSRRSMAGGSRCAGASVGEPKPSNSDTAVLNSAPVAALEEENTDLAFDNQDNPDTSFASFLETHLQDADDVKPHPTESHPEEENMQASHRTCLLPDANLVSGLSDTAAVISTSDKEEQFSESEDDVPYFSDIEAMILDMDLGTYDEESCLFSKEVSRYQHMDMKNTIRWEQGFLSHINRSISSHGAFAVFYGRHLKYFIRDPEVSVGRETKDAKVDIDLGREGRANKISRRQAIIKMDEEGSFTLKNIGKFSIFVNGKEVPAKKQINLLSHSLIKIQDMHFAFEVNESAVRNHIKRQRSRGESAFRFDWKSEQNP
ncbi:uncharacterized protein A4U43_C04F35690 [Asparagus officinalis]|uniref:FHA domain-containing protein n=1 Tax=Asparagus officinalis TaxID=4686 RepID=A0A5P1F8U1_ASPOF|nr:uncharacterized protein LOC109839662 [Asparagus officinalis]ONK73817.1 uncharacterized protein A4U43_C04F35690 [Asparagus officinalis]